MTATLAPEQVVTHELPVERAVEAFAAARDSAASGKVLVALWPERVGGA